MKNINKFNWIKYLILTHFWYARKFMAIGRKSVIVDPLQFSDVNSVTIGSRSYIAHGSWLMGEKTADKATLSMGDNVHIGHFAHIVAKKKVVIEDAVLIADKVYISDCKHRYEDIYTPIVEQEVATIGDVFVGEGSWIGENVCIIGSKIGKHCVIGANSVVTRDIPDYCVAVGSPAKVIKQYNLDTGIWEKVKTPYESIENERKRQ